MGSKVQPYTDMWSLFVLSLLALILPSHQKTSPRECSTIEHCKWAGLCRMNDKDCSCIYGYPSSDIPFYCDANLRYVDGLECRNNQDCSNALADCVDYGACECNPNIRTKWGGPSKWGGVCTRTKSKTSDYGMDMDTPGPLHPPDYHNKKKTNSADYSNWTGVGATSGPSDYSSSWDGGKAKQRSRSNDYNLSYKYTDKYEADLIKAILKE